MGAQRYDSYSDAELAEVKKAVYNQGSVSQAAKALGVSRSTVQRKIMAAEARGIDHTTSNEPDFEIPPLPSGDMPTADLVKHIDDYADQLGYGEQRHGASVVSIFDPDSPTATGFMHCFVDVEQAADYLKFKRKRWGRTQ